MLPLKPLPAEYPLLPIVGVGPAEIVRDGETGFLVEPDNVAGLVEAIEKLDNLDRACCRRQAEAEYSLEALGDRFEAWFYKLLHSSTT